MKAECMDAVRAAGIAKLGRSISMTELKNVEDRIFDAKKKLATQDPDGWKAKPLQEQLQLAAEEAAKGIQGEAVAKKVRIANTIKAQDTLGNYIASQKEKYGDSALTSLGNVLEHKNNGKQNFTSLDEHSSSITKLALSRLISVWDVAGPKLYGLFSDKAGTQALMHELYGKDSSEIVKPEIASLAKEAAKTWNETAEWLRQRFNRNGGLIGKLEDWRIPQLHSQIKIATAGLDKWLNNIFPKLDRSKYVNEDGSKMSDEQMNKFLKEAYVSLSTGGANKIEPGRFTGGGMVANRFREERSLHFNDADSQMAYMQEFGNPDLFSTMVSHVKSLSRDIGRMEVFGPNSDLQFKYHLDSAVKQESLANPKNIGKIKKQATYLQNTYNELSGKTQPVASQRLAQGFSTLRNYMAASKLGFAYWSALSHSVPFRLQAWAGGLSQVKLQKNILEYGNPLNHAAERRANVAGLGLDTMVGEVNKWSQDALGSGFSQKMASATIRLSGLNALNEGKQKAFGVTTMAELGRAIKENDNVHDAMGDFELTRQYGTTPTDFAVWKLAKQEDWGNGNKTMLTPESVYRIPDEKLSSLGNPSALRDNAATRLVSITSGEADMAINKPNSYTRGLGGLRSNNAMRGTLAGELYRQFMLFKTYPMGIIANQWMRGINMPTTGGKAIYIASLVAGMTLLGAVQEQIKTMLHGKDPEQMNNGQFFLKSLLKGGSFGMYGDFLNELGSEGDSRTSDLLMKSLGLTDFLPLKNDIEKSAAGNDDTHYAEHVIQLTRNNIPGNNIWYAQAALNRLIFDQMLEMASPGYNERVRESAAKNNNQQYFWRPGEILPDRGPNLGAAIQ